MAILEPWKGLCQQIKRMEETYFGIHSLKQKGSSSLPLACTSSSLPPTPAPTLCVVTSGWRPVLFESWAGFLLFNFFSILIKFTLPTHLAWFTGPTTDNPAAAAGNEQNIGNGELFSTQSKTLRNAKWGHSDAIRNVRRSFLSYKEKNHF